MNRGLAANADVTGLAAGVLLGVDGRQTHELVPTDLSHRAQAQVHRVCINHLQDDVLRVVERKAPLFILGTCQEPVVGEIQQGEPLLAEFVAYRATRCQHHDHVVVCRVHAVEICKVQVGVVVEESLGWHLEAVAAVRRVLRWGARIELGVTAEEDAFQLAANG